MSDQIVPTTEEISSPPVLFLDITLPVSGVSLRINKLKSKAHYEAQKIYSEWVRELQKLSEIKMDSKSVVDDNDSVNLVKFEAEYKDLESKRIAFVLDKSESLVKLRSQILSWCLGVPPEKIEEDYYPEDLDFLIGKCLEVNRFMDSLKKSVAPTAGIGV